MKPPPILKSRWWLWSVVWSFPRQHFCCHGEVMVSVLNGLLKAEVWKFLPPHCVLGGGDEGFEEYLPIPGDNLVSLQ